MFMQYQDLISAWKTSWREGLLWLVTFLASIMLDIDFGLGIGVLMAVIMNLDLNQNLDIYEMGFVPNNLGIFLDMRYYKAVSILK